MDASQLADVHAVEQVLYRYAVAIDTYDLDAFDEIFTPDAQLDTRVTGTLTPTRYRARHPRPGHAVHRPCEFVESQPGRPRGAARPQAQSDRVANQAAL